MEEENIWRRKDLMEERFNGGGKHLEEENICRRKDL